MFSDPRSAPGESNDDTPSGYPMMREVNSQELMQGTREIIIRHGEEAYRLSVPRSGKLILRK